MWRKKFITISNKPVIFFWYSIKSVPKLGQYASKLGQGWSKSCPNPTSFLGQYVPKLRQSGYILVQYGQLLDLHLLLYMHTTRVLFGIGTSALALLHGPNLSSFFSPSNNPWIIISKCKSKSCPYCTKMYPLCLSFGTHCPKNGVGLAQLLDQKFDFLIFFLASKFKHNPLSINVKKQIHYHIFKPAILMIFT